MLREQFPRKEWILGAQTPLCATWIYYIRSKGPTTFCENALTGGVEVTLLKQAAQTSATLGRPRKLRSEIIEILQNNLLSPAGASKLRGRLGFFTSLLVGRLGRGMMGPLIRRQYGTYARTLTPELRRNLLWRRNAIQRLPPRLVPLALFSPMGAHSDAQGHGHVAMRALFPLGVSISTHLPAWFVELTNAADAESPIYIYELAATALTACEFAYRNDGKPLTCVLRIDNQVALAALIKGSPPATLGAVLVNSNT